MTGMGKFRKIGFRVFSVLMALMLCVTLLGTAFVSYADENAETENAGDSESSIADILQQLDYDEYLSKHSKDPYAKESIVIGADAFVSSAGGIAPAETEDANGVKANAVVLTESNTWVEYKFTVNEAALYNLKVTYAPKEATTNAIELGFMFDGKYPYTNLANVSFSRIWVDRNKDGKFLKDDFGNEVRPVQVENARWNTEWAENSTGVYSDPYAVYLEAGEHVLRVVRQTEAIALQSVELVVYKQAQSYADYKKENSDKEIIKNTDYRIEAETAFEKNDNRLGATIDSTNAGMTPVSATVSVVNSFGQGYWSMNGQWASWKVPENLKEGMYVLRFRAKQNTNVGVKCFRKIYINGEVPFKEAESLTFEYNSGWFIQTAGGNDPYLFYFKPGDVITLEATTGAMSSVLNQIYTSVDTLNDIYKSIIMVTGINPDSERDYNIQKEIPTLLDDLKSAKKQIDSLQRQIESIMGETNSKTMFFKQFSTFLGEIIENYITIVDELATFKSYVDSYVAQTYDFNTLYVELDTIYIQSQNSKAPEEDASFWDSLVFEFDRFVYSFSDNYGKTDKDKEGKYITVWTSLGRDQAQAVKRLISEDFIPNSGVDVDFKMSVQSLTEAILAGLEPDVSLVVTQDVPIDLALRGQAVNLQPYLEKVKTAQPEWFNGFIDEAWRPFQYKGGTYAIPIGMDYNMMFYRSDILAELGVELPKTWDDFYDVLRTLQRNKFSVGLRESNSDAAGISTAINVFDMFLYQRGGKYFNDDLTKTAFESVEGKEAFVELVNLYKEYDVDTDINLLQRFRTGEVPIIITGSAFYQQVSATAREIQGNWGMTTVPGTPQEDGSINSATVLSVTGTIILKGAQRRGLQNEAFDFVKWWASANTQKSYSIVMESIEGIAGRQAVANIEAFENIGWTIAEKEVLKAQRAHTFGINQIPGMYIINRSITNALRTSYNDIKIDPLRQLNIQNRNINDELARKRAEFEQYN